MPVNETLPDHYVDGLCNLIGKADDGTYDLGTMQHLSPEECNLALENWDAFVKQYGGKYGIPDPGIDGNSNIDQKGGKGLFVGGLFSWLPGLGLVGSGKGKPPPPKPEEWLVIILVVAIVVYLILRKK